MVTLVKYILCWYDFLELNYTLVHKMRRIADVNTPSSHEKTQSDINSGLSSRLKLTLLDKLLWVCFHSPNYLGLAIWAFYVHFTSMWYVSFQCLYFVFYDKLVVLNLVLISILYYTISKTYVCQRGDSSKRVQGEPLTILLIWLCPSSYWCLHIFAI